MFVGRHQELKRLDELLRDPRGQAILVLGQQGMGKTMLVNRFAQLAADHPDLRCGSVRYEVTPSTDAPNGTAERYEQRWGTPAQGRSNHCSPATCVLRSDHWVGAPFGSGAPPLTT